MTSRRERETVVTNNRAALGGTLTDLVELGAIEFRPEALDAIVEGRLKAIWAARSCPNRGEKSLQALEDSERVWCGRCNWTAFSAH
jgi:ribosomal protein S27AE